MSTDAPLGVILAGGQAQRMGGGDKGLIEVGGRPLISHIIERLFPHVSGIVLNANGDPNRFEGFGYPVIADDIDGFVGPLAGVLAGMNYAAHQGARSIVTVAADTPFFPRDLVPRLVDAEPLALAATPDEKGRVWRHPTFGIWSISLRDALSRALQDGTRKVVAFTDQHECKQIEFAATPFDPFFNINHPEDVAQAEALWQEHNP